MKKLSIYVFLVFCFCIPGLAFSETEVSKPAQTSDFTVSDIKPAKTFRLFVETMPENARVRILNIPPVYHPGIKLKPGSYHIEVSAKRYAKQKKWVSLDNTDKTVKFILQKKPFFIQGRKAVNSMDMNFVFLKPGEFSMGSSLGETGRKSDEIQHHVTLYKGLYMQTTEVTQGQWKSLMGDTPSFFSGCGADCPVEQVTWHDVQQFIKKLNKREKTNKYRLPTEAEWEYACRAGVEGFRFFYGDNINDLGKYCWHRDNSKDTTHRVAQKKANKWGLYDMHGNVWEWCQDNYGSYSNNPETDPTGPSRGSEKVFRGGAWNVVPSAIRCAFRGYIEPAERLRLLGFRLVREP